MDNGTESYRRYCLEGDDKGLDDIITEYSDGLILYLTGVVGNIHIAEELAEDTFVLIGIKKPKFKGKCSFKTWLYVIGRNKAVDYMRKNKRNQYISIDELSELTSEEDAVETNYIKREQQIILHKAMRKLKPEYQQALWLVYFEELSNKEAAMIMNRSIRGLESLLYRARKVLKTQLESEGFSYENT